MNGGGHSTRHQYRPYAGTGYGWQGLASTGSTWDVKVTAAACSTLVGVDNTVGREDPVEILVFSDYL